MTAPTKKERQAREDAIALLSAPNAYGCEGEGREIILVGARNGVSVRIGKMARKTADQLVADDLAVWDKSAMRARLRLTATGWAHFRRQSSEQNERYLAQHRPLTREPVTPDGRDVLRDEAESPLAWLARRKGRDGQPLIEAACLEAGERLRRDLTTGALLPRVTANWSASVASGPRATGAADMTDVMISARQRARAALQAVGPDFADLLIDVCGFLKGLELVEAERRWPARSGKLALELALRQLARHYGLQSEARGRAHRPLRHWGVADYRPILQDPPRLDA
jgi:hypothetical protein